MSVAFSMFGQILQVIPEKAFENAASAHNADRNSKGVQNLPGHFQFASGQMQVWVSR
jgi:hypothetical protein